jgi:hypothetical protein
MWTLQEFLSVLYVSFYKEPCSFLPYRDFSLYIFSALRSYSKDGKIPAHNATYLDGTLRWDVLCETVLKTLYANGIWCGLTPNKVQGFQSDYPFYSRLYDEHIQSLITAAQVSSALLADVLEHIDCSQYGQQHNPHNQDTAHLSNSDDFRLAFYLSFLIKLYTTQYNYSPRLSQDNKGRWPSNFIHDGSEEVVRMFPLTNGMASQVDTKDTPSNYFGLHKNAGLRFGRGDSGSAARFFYTAKASRSERNDGLYEFDARPAQSTGWSGDGMPLRQDGTERKMPLARNNHPTVKPVSLMRYLCRLITPPSGIVADLFMGSGSTGIAAKLEGFNFIGIEKEEQYIKIAEARIKSESNIRQEVLPL